MATSFKREGYRTKEIQIRPMEISDVIQAIRVANQAFVEGARFTARIGEGIARHLEEHRGWQFVAEKGGDLIGFLTGKPGGEAFVSWIAVHPAHQGRGIGGMLLKAIEAKARGQGIKEVRLGTPFARSFYEKHGYRCVEVQRRMVLDLIGKSISPPHGLCLRPVVLDDLPQLLPLFYGEGEYLKFLSAYFSAFDEHTDEALMGKRDGRTVGVLLGRSDSKLWDLITLSYLFARSKADALDVLQGLVYTCSRQGRRWVGVGLPIPYVEEGDLTERGWQDAQLPMFWTGYRMRKAL